MSRRILLGAVAIAGAMVGTTLVAVPPAIAGECSRQTGGNNDRVMWTGSGYTCAYVADNGDNKIGAFATEVWTSSTAPGYEKRFKCQRNSGGVSISSVYTNSGGTNIGSSITFTAFNTKDGSRHWTGAVLWNTPKGGEGEASQFRDNCDGYTIKSNLFYVPRVSLSGPTQVASGGNAAYQISVTTPDGGGPATGSVALFHQASTSQTAPNPSGRRCDGTTRATTDVLVGQAPLVNGVATISNDWYGPSQYKLYAVFAGQPLGSGGIPPYCAAPPVSGLTGGISNTILLTSGSSSQQASLATTQPRGDYGWPRARLQVVNARAVAPSAPVARCSAGWVPMQSNVASPTALISESEVTLAGQGARVRTNTLPPGTVVRLQTVCRPNGSGVAKLRGISYGSQWGDRIASGTRGSVMFGGLGRDTLVVRNTRTVALGGPGADRVVVAAGGSAANGGAGQDRLTAQRSGSLLVGGSGRDRIVGAPGVTRINAADGRPGDVVICKGSQNQVVADAGDKLRGNCQIVVPTP